MLVNTWPVVPAAISPVPPLFIGSTPLVPVVSGNPVRFVAIPDTGVPKSGDSKVGEFDNTTVPVPVEEVTPVPPLATGKVPVIVSAVVEGVVQVKVPSPVLVNTWPVVPSTFG